VGGNPGWTHRIPGQGEMDYPPIVRALQDIGFGEAITVETFTDMDFDEACEVGYATLAGSVAGGSVS
jgi:sugar phosphate isomerase/epimerase